MEFSNPRNAKGSLLQPFQLLEIRETLISSLCTLASPLSRHDFQVFYSKSVLISFTFPNIQSQILAHEVFKSN